MNLHRVTTESLGTLGTAKGAYVLVFRLASGIDVSLKGKAPAHLAPGWYLYAGSAYGGGGMQARLRRHFLRDKKIHWHIDRLATEAADIMAFAEPDGSECGLVDRLMKTGQYIHIMPGFGSSDCQTCESHLLMARGTVPEGGFDSLPI
ncbi:DUF123 domain-containing protein [Kordiimonas marina]|uniref:DUF123 domain-containing protein n=1 Tax=Kordiimonas marina TaxID=2872312 RepID=UPI001FF26388|nr:DUF123 domain-containing protein [Kordiimonas marina]MCJ9428879.1 DUF123 domain-containing protein [Kordiimonas marina]